MEERVKCKYCNEKFFKINLKDHYKECYKSPELEEIGGWLALFVVCLYSSAISLLFGSINILSSSVFFSLTFILYFGYTVYIIYLIHKRAKKFRRLTIYYLWLSVTIAIVEVIYFMLTLGKKYYNEWLNLFLSNQIFYWAALILVDAIWAIVWTQYLLKSERVKNTLKN